LRIDYRVLASFQFSSHTLATIIGQFSG
jgi:hypothetical protein